MMVIILKYDDYDDDTNKNNDTDYYDYDYIIYYLIVWKKNF